MRILIITHPRSGGKSLLDWISNEKRYKSYHEPLMENCDICDQVFHEDNIVVKIFPFSILNSGKDIQEMMVCFDKIICHLRLNQMDVSISMIHGEEMNNNDNWHELYTVDSKWLEDNKDKIDEQLEVNSKLYDDILKMGDKCLKTTYEGIYQDKTDIDKLLSFLEINNPRYLDILDSRHRLKNGDVGTKDYTVKRNII